MTMKDISKAMCTQWGDRGSNMTKGNSGITKSSGKVFCEEKKVFNREYSS